MKASKETVKLSRVDKLKNIEDSCYEIGKACSESFDKSADIVTVRATVAAYRCSMQAMRDSMRYAIKKK